MKKPVKLKKSFLILGAAFGSLLTIGYVAEALGLNGGELIYTLLILGVPGYFIFRAVRKKRKLLLCLFLSFLILGAIPLILWQWTNVVG